MPTTMLMGKLGITRTMAVLLIVAFLSAGLALPCEPGCSDCACHCDCTCCPAADAAIGAQAVPLLEWAVCGYVSTEWRSICAIPVSVVPPPPQV